VFFYCVEITQLDIEVGQFYPYKPSWIDRSNRKLPTLDFRLRTNMISDTDGLTKAVYLTTETAELVWFESPLSQKLTIR